MILNFILIFCLIICFYYTYYFSYTDPQTLFSVTFSIASVSFLTMFVGTSFFPSSWLSLGFHLLALFVYLGIGFYLVFKHYQSELKKRVIDGQSTRDLNLQNTYVREKIYLAVSAWLLIVIIEFIKPYLLSIWSYVVNFVKDIFSSFDREYERAKKLLNGESE